MLWKGYGNKDTTSAKLLSWKGRTPIYNIFCAFVEIENF